MTTATTTSTRDEVITAVESYVQALGSGNLTGSRLHPDVVYQGPLTTVRGAEALGEFLSQLFPVVTGVSILDHLVEGNRCATRFDLHLVGASLQVFDRFEVADGLLTSINPYYDPAPLVAALRSTGAGASPSVTGIHHVSLTVSDVERSVGWYRALLNLGEIMRGDDETVSFRVLAGDGVVMSVRQYHKVRADGFDEMRTGMDHMAFEVSSRQELERWEQVLRERDIPFSPIADTPIGWVIVFRDPDNIQLEFWHSLPAS